MRKKIPASFLYAVSYTHLDVYKRQTQRRFLLHANPLQAEWVTKKIGTDAWITDLPQIKALEKFADDPQSQKEFMEIKYQNKLRLAKYIKEHNGIDIDPNSIFDVQVKRLHEYKRQLMNILHVLSLIHILKLTAPTRSAGISIQTARHGFQNASMARLLWKGSTS